MKPIGLLLLAGVLISATTLAGPVQDPEPQQQPQPLPPQPEPEPEPPQRPDYQAERLERERENRRADEMDRQNSERTSRMLRELGLDAAPDRRAPRPLVSQPHFAPVMQHDSEFDLQSIPLMQWLSARDALQIPWKIDVKSAALRMDQRLEVAYTARIQAKHLNKLGNAHELFFIIGVSSPTGEWLVMPKVVHYTIKTELPEGVELWFSDWVFTQPGNYVLWFVLYDRQTVKHNVERRHVQVSQPDNNPFPAANERLPKIELPRLSDRLGGTVLSVYDGLLLPVENKQKLRVELIPVLSPPEQWTGQEDILRSHREQTVATINTLSQMQLASGSISITGLDVIRRETPFQEKELSRIDWTTFVEALNQSTNNQIVSTATLFGNKSGGTFFRNAVSQRLADSREVLRVLIVVTSSLRFERGSDLQTMKVQGDCHCRVYHLRFRHNPFDGSDDIGKLIKSLDPRTFNISNARDLQKALVRIISDLEEL